ncbi:MAG: lipopolysaccharide transport periplasmic protein LptA [Campylobacteraceae bacterium]|nr:lipopolysaccharide transport periplasmic protein LptA [Campylobacteraceae bacterium]
MKKKLIVILFLTLFAKAEQIEINADNIYVDEKSQLTEFTGNVTVTKGKDELAADKIIVYATKAGQPLKYIASGNVYVKVLLNEKRYNASGNALIYETEEQKYTLEGNAFLTEVDTDRKVYGEIIEANQISGTYSVKGKDSEPAKFVFQIEDRQ